MSGPGAALRYLTLVPVPGPGAEGPAAVGRAAVWFPVVGLALGLVLVGVERATRLLFPPLLGAALTLAVWKGASGGLHLDGLADCADGLAGADAGARLHIMRDGRVGAFGASGLVLVLALQGAALAGLAPDVRAPALLVTPALARATPALLARLFPSARADGQGAAFRAGLGPAAAPLGLGLALAIGALALGACGVAALGAVTLTSLALASFMGRRLGGVTGDVLGAAVELGELAALLTVAAWTHLGR